MKYEGSSVVTGISQQPYLGIAERLFTRYGRQSIPCTLVPEPDNKFDPNAVRVVIQTVLGPECPGYLENRRYCPNCKDTPEGRRGFKAYGSDAVTKCKLCGNDLMQGVAERVTPRLVNSGAMVQANLVFTGKEEGKENLGAVVRWTITLPDDEE